MTIFLEITENKCINEKHPLSKAIIGPYVAYGLLISSTINNLE